MPLGGGPISGAPISGGTTSPPGAQVPAFKLGSIGSPCCPCSSANCTNVACSPCNIPKGDLTVRWLNSLTGNGSATLKYRSATGTWDTFDAPVDSGIAFQLSCVSPNVRLAAYFSYPVGPTTQACVSGVVAPHNLTLVSSQCTPFGITYSLSNTSCPTLFSAGNSQFILTGPNTSFGVCPVCFRVIGCMNAPVAGATVSITGGVMGVTGADGIVILDIGTAGVYSVGVTATGYANYLQSLTLSCLKPVGITLTSSSTTACCGGCPGGTLPKTLHVTAQVGLTAMGAPVNIGPVAATYYSNIGTSLPSIFGPPVCCNTDFIYSGLNGVAGWVASGTLGATTWYMVLICGPTPGSFQYILFYTPAGIYHSICLFDAIGYPSLTSYTCSPFSAVFGTAGVIGYSSWTT